MSIPISQFILPKSLGFGAGAGFEFRLFVAYYLYAK